MSLYAHMSVSQSVSQSVSHFKSGWYGDDIDTTLPGEPQRPRSLPSCPKNPDPINKGVTVPIIAVYYVSYLIQITYLPSQSLSA
jgi:hypothetical protein